MLCATTGVLKLFGSIPRAQADYSFNSIDDTLDGVLKSMAPGSDAGVTRGHMLHVAYSENLSSSSVAGCFALMAHQASSPEADLKTPLRFQATLADLCWGVGPVYLAMVLRTSTAKLMLDTSDWQ